MRKILIFLVFLISLGPFSSYSQEKIKILTLKGDIINPVTADYIQKGVENAQTEDALLILIIDTPGGLLKSTEKIVKLLLNSSVPIITYVHPKGAKLASAGVFIGYASHILAMSPSTHIGAAHPVLGGGKWGTIDTQIQKKIINDTLAWAENISQIRKRPFRFIKDAIKESISITEKEALKKGVSDLTVESLDELIKKINGWVVQTKKGKKTINTKNSSKEWINFTRREKFLNSLIDPNIAYLLLTLGFLGLIFEVTHPGFGFPGIAGIICLILSFYAFSILPVNYAGLTLIILGIVFFLVEAFTPTFGLFTLGGIVSFILGSVMLFNQPEIIRASLKTILPIGLFFTFLSIFFITRTLVILKKKSSTGAEGLIGKMAIAKTQIAKKGKVFIHGEIWDAISEDKIKKGQAVIVERVEGLKLFVKRKEG